MFSVAKAVQDTNSSDDNLLSHKAGKYVCRSYMEALLPHQRDFLNFMLFVHHSISGLKYIFYSCTVLNGILIRDRDVVMLGIQTTLLRIR